MLHHPTKYHTNALTHFLNLHTSAAAAAAAHAHATNTATPTPPNVESVVAAANLINSNNSSSGGQQNNNNTNIPNHHHQIDYNTTTFGGSDGGGGGCNSGCMSPNSIDGKSFTIAAILGLNNNNSQRNRNFNEVVNLSLNPLNQGVGGGGGGNTPASAAATGHHNKHFMLGNFDRVPSHMFNDGTGKQFNGFNGHNHHHHHHQHHNHHQQQQTQQHSQNPASALQNLQQLHQQHINATAAGNFVSREKYKSVLDQQPSKKSSMKSKRVRTIFTPEQLERLEAEFERQQYMVGPERLYLAHTLQLTEAQVKVWFQNRRIKWRKHHLEVTQQRLALIRQRQSLTGTAAANLDGSPNDQKDDIDMTSGSNMSPDSPDLTVCSDSRSDLSE